MGVDWKRICRELRLPESECETCAQIAHALGRLEVPADRVPITTLFARDIDDRNIAAVLRLTPAAVNKAHNRVRQHLGVRGKGCLVHRILSGNESG